MTRELKLGNGGFALVDDEDYERVAQSNWTLDRNGYVVRMIQVQPPPNLKRKKVMLHRFITDAPYGMDVDHANKNKLDNRKGNLRVATRSQNNANSGPNPRSASPYKGVRKSIAQSGDIVWRAAIVCEGKEKYLGKFRNQEHAARAYDKAAFAAWGEFAYLNFPGDMAQQVSAARS